ncbi:MAG: hypothetical protein IT427_16520 [Pirellulales bacterium]|nr:hypothetical protein [Pirellulales bacterium]
MTFFRWGIMCAVVVGFIGSAQGVLVYRVVPYPDSPSGWSIGGGPGWSFDSGTITTINGFSGDLTAANIPTTLTSWSFTFTSPRTTTTLNPSNSTFSYWNDNIAPNLTVSGGEIYFPLASSGRDQIRIFSNALVVGGSYSGSPETEVSFASKYGDNNFHFAMIDRLTPSLVAAVAAPSIGAHLVATAVPEASSFASTGLAFVVVVLGCIGVRRLALARERTSTVG